MKTDLTIQWFNNLKRFWLTKDIASVRSLLSEEFQYFEDPNEAPLTNWEDVENAWKEVNNQHDIELVIWPLLIKGRESTSGYKLKYKDHEGGVRESSGAYYVKLDESGKALEFRQWWVSK